VHILLDKSPIPEGFHSALQHDTKKQDKLVTLSQQRLRWDMEQKGQISGHPVESGTGGIPSVSPVQETEIGLDLASVTL